MYRPIVLITLAFVSMLSFTHAGHTVETPDTRDVVHTLNGTIVTDRFGNCVRTESVLGGDACGSEASFEQREILQEERTVYFAFNQTALTPEAKQKLNGLANILKSEKDIKEARIIGYADRIGSAAYNERLSERRAESVRAYIVSRGFIHIRAVGKRWVGEAAPVTNCPHSLSRPALIECLQKDRKVEVEIDYLPEGKAPERR